MSQSNIHYLIYSVTLVIVITITLIFISGIGRSAKSNTTRHRNSTDDSSKS